MWDGGESGDMKQSWYSNWKAAQRNKQSSSSTQGCKVGTLGLPEFGHRAC